MAVGSQPAGPTAGDEHGGVDLLDDGWTSDDRIGGNVGAAPHRQLPPSGVVPHLPATGRAARAGKRRRSRRGAWQAADGRGAQGHDLDGRADVGVGEALAMHRMEIIDEPVQRPLIERRAVHADRQLERLALVAHVGGEPDVAVPFGHTVRVEARSGLGQQLDDSRGKRREHGGLGRDDPRAHEIVLEVGVQDAEGRERCGIDGEHHALDSQLLRNGHRMQARRPAEGKQHELPRVEPLLEQRQSNGGAEVAVGHRQKPVGGGLGGKAEWKGDVRLYCPVRGFDVQRHLAAQEASRDRAVPTPRWHPSRSARFHHARSMRDPVGRRRYRGPRSAARPEAPWRGSLRPHRSFVSRPLAAARASNRSRLA